MVQLEPEWCLATDAIRQSLTQPERSTIESTAVTSRVKHPVVRVWEHSFIRGARLLQTDKLNAQFKKLLLEHLPPTTDAHTNLTAWLVARDSCGFGVSKRQGIVSDKDQTEPSTRLMVYGSIGRQGGRRRVNGLEAVGLRLQAVKSGKVPERLVRTEGQVGRLRDSTCSRCRLACLAS